MENFDVSPAPAFESDTLPAPPDVIHVPSVAAGAKRKGRPAKVSPPSMALFAAAINGGRYWLGVDRDDDSGMAVRVFTGDVLVSVDYSGPSDRTLVPELKGKKGCYSEPLQTDCVPDWFRGNASCATLDAASVASALDYLMPAMSTDLTRYNLSAVHLDTNGKWVATDGHRLHLVTGMDTYLPRAMLVPAAAIRALSKAIKATKTTQVGIEDRGGDIVSFIVHGEHLSVRITARLVDGQFPDYTQVLLDTSTAHAFTVDAKEARSVIAAAPLIGDKCNGRDFSFNDEGVTTYRHDKRPSRIPCQYLAGCNVAVRLNAKYVDQALSECDGATTFYVGADDFTPLTITNGQRLVVVMPIRK